MMLKKWPMDASLFDGDALAGPCPTLFAEDIPGTADAIGSDDHKAHWDINKINKSFFTPEIINMKAALAYVKKPRYR